MKLQVNQKLTDAGLQPFCNFYACWGCVKKKNIDIGRCKDHLNFSDPANYGHFNSASSRGEVPQTPEPSSFLRTMALHW